MVKNELDNDHIDSLPLELETRPVVVDIEENKKCIEMVM